MSRLEQLRKFLEDEPADVFTHYAIALEYVSQKQFDDAIGKFEEVLALDPNYVAAYQQMGMLYAHLKKNPEALNILERGIRAADITGDLHARAELEEARDSLES